LTQITPERGTKRTCASCASRFYDLDRTPAICPKCGTEYVEPVRAAPAYQPRKRGVFGARSPAQTVEPENDGNPDAQEPSDDEERESDDEHEEELDGEADHESGEEEPRE